MVAGPAPDSESSLFHIGLLSDAEKQSHANYNNNNNNDLTMGAISGKDNNNNNMDIIGFQNEDQISKQIFTWVEKTVKSYLKRDENTRKPIAEIIFSSYIKSLPKKVKDFIAFLSARIPKTKTRIRNEKTLHNNSFHREQFVFNMTNRLLSLVKYGMKYLHMSRTLFLGSYASYAEMEDKQNSSSLLESLHQHDHIMPHDHTSIVQNIAAMVLVNIIFSLINSAVSVVVFILLLAVFCTFTYRYLIFNEQSPRRVSYIEGFINECVIAAICYHNWGLSIGLVEVVSEIMPRTKLPFIRKQDCACLRLGNEFIIIILIIIIYRHPTRKVSF